MPVNSLHVIIVTVKGKEIKLRNNILYNENDVEFFFF